MGGWEGRWRYATIQQQQQQSKKKKRGREVNYDDGRILEEIFWNVCTRHDCYAMYNTEATGWLVGFEFWLLCFSIQTKRRRNALA